MAYFNQIEEAAKSGDEQSLSTKIANLREHLADQEKMVKQAHAVSAENLSGTGSSAFDKMARQLSTGTLDQAKFNMAMREATLSATATAQNKDIRPAQSRLLQVHDLMNENRVAEANKIMTQLEAEFR